MTGDNSVTYPLKLATDIATPPFRAFVQGLVQELAIVAGIDSIANHKASCILRTEPLLWHQLLSIGV